MNIRLPMWALRRLVRANPWLLSNSGEVNRTLDIPVPGLGNLEIHANLSLSERQREKLLAEIKAPKAR